MDWHEDKTLLVLCFLTIVSLIGFFIVIYAPPKGDVALTVMSALLTGSFTALMKHLPGGELVPPPGTTEFTKQTTQTSTEK
jgi:hypothetical protein